MSLKSGLKNVSLKMKLGIGLGALILLSFTAFTVVSYNSTYDAVLEGQHDSMEQMTATLAGTLQEYLDQASIISILLAKDKQLAFIASGDNNDFSQLEASLKELPGAEAVYVFDQSGKVMGGAITGGKPFSAFSVADRDYFKITTSGEKYIGNSVIESRFTGVPAFVVAAPIRNAFNQVVGGLGITVDFTKFSEKFILPVKLGDRGYPYILDQNGVIIAHPSADLMLKDVSKFQFVKDSLAKPVGAQNYMWQGESKFQFWQQLENGWVLVSSVYETDLSGPAKEQRNVLAGIGLLGILLTLGAALYLIARQVVRPVNDVQKFAEQVADGNYNASLDNDYEGEMGALASHITTMVAELKNKLGFSQGLLEGLTLPCIVGDTNENVVFINQPCLDFLDRKGKPKDYLGQKLGKVFYDDESRQTLNGKVLQDGNALVGERTQLVTTAGNSKEMQADVAPIKDLDGKLIATYGIFTDLTEIVENQRRMEQQNEMIAHTASQALDIAEQVSSAAEELSAQIQESSQGADNQRGRLTESATSMEQMNSTVLEVARNSSSAAEISAQAKNQAMEGSEIVKEVMETISSISTKAEELKRDMGELGDQAESIGQVMTVIADIADQTNLLALNAAIEAARAGEAGRGFAVVADEVRKLAEKTMAATTEVGQAIRAIQGSARKNIASTDETVEVIARSTELAHGSAESLAKIVKLAEETADQVRSIATAAEQQSASSEEISTAMEQINQIAGENAEAMSQSNQAVTDLAGLAGSLRQLMDEMRS